jgi:hypothetical protein
MRRSTRSDSEVAARAVRCRPLPPRRLQRGTRQRSRGLARRTQCAPTGRHFVFPDPEVLIADREARPLRAFDDPNTEGLQRSLVERATACEVAYWQHHMIKQPRWPTRHESSLSGGVAGAEVAQRHS